VLVRGNSDLSALRERIPIPEGLRGRWAAGRRRVRAVAGFEPVPIELVIWIPVPEEDAGAVAASSWAVIGDVLGGEGPPATIALHADAAREVAPVQVSRGLVEGFHVRVTGPRYPARLFEGGGFAEGRAVRVEGGLLVGLTSRGAP
jgi:hypothetical protein